MARKGTKQSLATRQKQSLAHTKITESHLVKTGNEYIEQLKANPKQLPTLTGLCLATGIHNTNLIEFRNKFSKFDKIVNYIETLQEEYLLTNGITGKANPVFSIFLLKSKHKYFDQPQNLTQNNNFNITPELLKSALQLIDKE